MLLSCAILYKEFDHLQILVSTGNHIHFGTIPLWILRDNCIQKADNILSQVTSRHYCQQLQEISNKQTQKCSKIQD